MIYNPIILTSWRYIPFSLAKNIDQKIKYLLNNTTDPVLYTEYILKQLINY